jgi:hypothetical protein
VLVADAHGGAKATNDKQTNDKHTNDKHTNDKHTNDKHTNDKHTNDKQTNDKHTNDKHTNDKHTNEKQTNATTRSRQPMNDTERIVLGTVTLASGTLAIYDVGVTSLVRAGLAPELPVVLVPGLPAGSTLDVLAAPIETGDFAGNWDHVLVMVAPGVVARSERVGEVIVDFARVLFIDDAARAHWNHDGSLDGRADYVFWGRDAAALAAVVGAPALAGSTGDHGWVDAPLDDVLRHGERTEAERQARGLRVATDFRPHSHHWQALEDVRRSAHGAGVVDVDGARACLWMTSWGDGIFPVFRDVDASGALLRVRVQLFADATVEAPG